jgi:two-component system chemotaxis response regulator CheB
MTTAEDFPSRLGAVAIGASAGGIQALRVLLESLPESFEPPVFVVQHIPRDRPSTLAELFGNACALPSLKRRTSSPSRPAPFILRRPTITFWWKAGRHSPCRSMSR